LASFFPLWLFLLFNVNQGENVLADAVAGISRTLVYGSYPYDLKRHNIPHKIVKPIESAQKPPKPATLIPWKSLVLIAAVVGVIAFIASTSSSDGDKEESRRR
jgi:hypothetical protein